MSDTHTDDAKGEFLGRCSEPERVFFRTVLEPTIGAAAYNYIQPQYSFEQPDGRVRRIDFALVTPAKKYAIELDGFTYHAEGIVTPAKHSDDLARQNELVVAGWVPLRFSWHQVQSAPDYCCDQLRRAVISDPHLHPSLLAGALAPHPIQTEALQRLALTRLEGRKRALVVLPTGLGKTFLAAFDAKEVGGRVLFIVHNNTILQQARDAFQRVWPDATVGLYNGQEQTPEADLVFANIATLRSKARREVFAPDAFAYMVVDEFHHGAADSYRSVMAYFRPRFLLGLTGTPDRTDQQSVLALLDNNCVYSLSSAQAIQRGFLVPFKFFGLRDNIDYSNIRHNGYRYDISDLDKALLIPARDKAIVSEYSKYCAGKKAIGFCNSIKHAERAAEAFRELGHNAVAIHSGLRPEQFRQRANGFRAGDYTLALVRDVFNEGVDFPDVEALLFMRPTESRIVFLQQLGRGLRLSPQKSHVIVLDFIGNYVNADKVGDYLSDAGGVAFKDSIRGARPVLNYDNGCEVTFTRSAVDVVATIGRSAARDDQLMGALSRLYEAYGRCPSFAEVCSAGRYAVDQYIRRYGTWDAAVDRFEKLIGDVGDVDVSALRMPVLLRNASSEEDADTISLNAELVIGSLLDSLAAGKRAWMAFVALSKVPPTPKRVITALHTFCESAQTAREWLNETLPILLLNFVVDETPSTAVRSSDAIAVSDAVTNRLQLITRSREAYTMPRSFAEQESRLDSLSVLMAAVQTNCELTDLVPSLREWVVLLRRFSDAATVSDRLLATAEEEHFGSSASDRLGRRPWESS